MRFLTIEPFLYQQYLRELHVVASICIVQNERSTDLMMIVHDFVLTIDPKLLERKQCQKKTFEKEFQWSNHLFLIFNV